MSIKHKLYSTRTLVVTSHESNMFSKSVSFHSVNCAGFDHMNTCSTKAHKHRMSLVFMQHHYQSFIYFVSTIPFFLFRVGEDFFLKVGGQGGKCSPFPLWCCHCQLPVHLPLNHISHNLTYSYRPGNKLQVQVSHFICTVAGIIMTDKKILNTSSIWVVIKIACTWHTEEIILPGDCQPHIKWDTCPCDLLPQN